MENYRSKVAGEIPSVILSGGQSPESKDLRTNDVLSRWPVRRSFDALRLLRMTNGSFLRIRKRSLRG